MASVPTLFLASLLIFSAMDAAFAERKVFKVGGEEGWKVPDENNSAIYSHWATSHRFHVGDALYFSFVNDSVLVVDKFGFFHCNTSNPTYEFYNGKAMVELTEPGLYYFISGAPLHCEKGQRLIVEVMHFHNSPPSSIANPPAGMINSPSPSPSHSQSSGHLAASISLVSVLLVVLIPLFVALVAF